MRRVKRVKTAKKRHPLTPEELAREASFVKAIPKLTDYREAILTLRKKGYTIKEVAKWLNQKVPEIAASETRVCRLLLKEPRPTSKR